MSHEIRTPLNTIIGLSELTLSGEKLPLKTYENIEKIYSAGATLLHIVNDILDISKVESGKFELIPAEYEVASLINDTIMLNILRINDKPIEFIVNVDEVLPLKLLGDEIRVKQIFNNLLSNAFKYTENGVVEWSITFSRDGSDVWIISKVRDTGIGIHNEDIETLFSNYRRLDMKRNRSTEGTGLGLAIAQQMAEMMDGSISVESSYGGGSTFTLRIRQGFAGSTPIGAKTVDNLKNFTYTDKKRDRKTRLFRSQLPHARVLIVDDVQTNLDVSKGMMELYGMTVDCVTNGQASIDLIRKGEKKYDAIFMDHMMPGMDGIEAMKRIRQIGTDYAQSIPIIALTANAIAGNDVLFIKEGFQAFLSKPIDTTTLDNIIKRWIGNGSMSNSQSEPKNGMFDGISINGLDIDKGLSRFDDNNIMYLKVIKSYSHNTKQLLQKIIAFSENIENNIDEYIITIHGIKGSSYNIFANTIGKKAEELEKAARTRDLQFIAENNGELAKLMQNLINDIEAFTDNVELDIPEKESPDSELLRQLKEECAKFNMDGVNNIMKELEKYKYTQGQELTTWLREQVTLMEFSKIINRLSEGEG
jgi:signal transduction histidine kinase